jgi:photosystem II stability/assembly factor-like uncharacterized protein
MASTATKRRREKKRPVQHPKRQDARKSRVWWLLSAASFAATLVLVAIVLVFDRGGGQQAPATRAGLPNTPDYHSLLVAPDDPNRLLLGTHLGLYASADGGRSWSFQGLSGKDAMNLARPSKGVVWTAGHNVLARSTDGGASWSDVRPAGLPSLDVHGFAVDPKHPQRLYAAVAGQGLYRSTDGGESFALVSRTVGPAVMGLAVTPDADILAGDMQKGLLASRDDGRTWHRTLAEGVMGLALNPADPKRAIATGSGIFLSSDQGESWREVLPLSAGGGPVAWSPSNPQIAYVVSFDKTLYKSTDGGASWRPVS